MIEALQALAPEALEALAGALESGRLAPPYGPLAVRALVAEAQR